MIIDFGHVPKHDGAASSGPAPYAAPKIKQGL